MRIRHIIHRVPFLLCLLSALAVESPSASGQSPLYRSQSIPVPGTGKQIDYVGDDFEEADWRFVHNMPKSSREQNERTYGPMGYSVNGRWSEGPERGQPDLLKVIPTPPNGLAGSKQALQITTMRSGIPGSYSYDVQQDDLILNISPRIGSTIRASELPNCVVRVYLPSPELWENRSGPHFGIRLGLRTTAEKPREGLFAIGTKMQTEPYWPGIWIHFQSETSRGVEVDAALLKVRGNQRGGDFEVKEIPVEQFGWWTFGMSVTGDGAVHYFARPGVEDLTMADHLTSQFPYGYQAERLNSFFFNICNRNDGRTWSTPFVIDDPQVFLIHSSRIDQLVDRKIQYQQRRSKSASRSGRSGSKSR
jgi:hypothetical protein